MRRRWLARALIIVGATAAVAGLCGVQEAAAEGISVQGATLPTTASPGASTTACDLTGGPYQNQDVWVFAAARGDQLDSLTATFLDTAGNPVGWQLLAGDQALDLAGRSVAWLRTPAGWTLTTATATTAAVTGGPLLMTGTCPAATELALMPQKPTAAPARAATLPVTGHDVGGMLAIGLALVIGGGLLVTVRRQRPRTSVTPAPRDDALVWTYPDR